MHSVSVRELDGFFFQWEEGEGIELVVNLLWLLCKWDIGYTARHFYFGRNGSRAVPNFEGIPVPVGR